jgi:hypothetical protein
MRKTSKTGHTTYFNGALARCSNGDIRLYCGKDFVVRVSNDPTKRHGHPRLHRLLDAKIGDGHPDWAATRRGTPQ